MASFLSAQQTSFLSSEEVMTSGMWTMSGEDRRYFIGGSDARIVMGNDEAALSAAVAGKARRG